MRGINKVILVGTLGRDPEAKYFADNGVASNFTIATSESWVDKNSGERIEQTEWHRITATGQRAEICNQYLRKGSKVYIEGSLRTRSWIDQDTGHEKFITEIRLEKLEMLSSPQEEQQHNHQNQGYNSNQNNGYSSQHNYNNGSGGRQQQRGGYTNGNNRGNYPRNTNSSRNQNDSRRDSNQHNTGWQGQGRNNNSNYPRNNQNQNSGYQRTNDKQNNNFNNNQNNDNNYRRNNGNGNNNR